MKSKLKELEVTYQLATINEFKRRLNNSKSEERYNILMDFMDFYKYEIYTGLSGRSVEYESTMGGKMTKALELLEATHHALTMRLKLIIKK